MSLVLSETKPRPVLQVIGLAAAMAMLTTALEFGAHALKLAFTDGLAHQSLDIVWAGPLANLALMVPVSLVLARFSDRTFLAFLTFPVFAAPVLILRPGSPLPLLVLAAGLASQAWRLMQRPRVQATLKRTGAALAGLFIAAAAMMQVRQSFRERVPRGAALPPDGAPNVLLIILDTVRGASLSHFGGGAATPHLDSLADSGVLFERGISTASWTLPAHASLFTGLWPYEHGADWRVPLGDSATTLAEVFSRAGYRTGGFAANVIYTSREHGMARGFQAYRDYRRTPGAILRAAALWQTALTSTRLRRLTGFHDLLGRKYGVDVNEEFLDWLGTEENRPWFAFLNYFDAHEPYLPRPPYRGRYSAGLPARRFDRLRFWPTEAAMTGWEDFAPAEVEAERAAYEESITGLDADLGALLEELRRRGQRDRTLVVVTSDHGELFGEHNRHSHGNTLYWRSIHVPLVFTWPGRLPAGQREAAPVSLRDVPATILSLALPDSPRLPGTPILGAGAAPAFSSLVMSELSRGSDPAMRRDALQSVIGMDWLYIRSATGKEDAYRVSSDWSDSVITDPALRAAVIDSGRARLTQSRVPPLPRIP